MSWCLVPADERGEGAVTSCSGATAVAYESSEATFLPTGYLRCWDALPMPTNEDQRTHRSPFDLRYLAPTILYRDQHNYFSAEQGFYP